MYTVVYEYYKQIKFSIGYRGFYIEFLLPAQVQHALLDRIYSL